MSNTNTVENESIHGHLLRELIAEVGRPLGESDLKRLIAERFGPTPAFHTCCQKNLSLSEALAFFVARGKIQLRDGFYSAAPEHDCGGHGHDHARH